jgi:hypothetical protein
MRSMGMPARGLKALTSYIACLGLAFHTLAWYIDDANSPHSYITSFSLEGDKCAIGIYDPQGCNGESIDFVASNLPKSLRLPTLKLKVYCSSESKNYYTFSDISARIASMGARIVNEVIGKKINSLDREAFIVVGWNGEPAYGLGEEASIRLPGFSAPFFAHTHPSTLCYPSHKDVESTANFFSEGGIVSLISSTSCMYVLRLQKPFIEDDYWSMLEIARRVRRAKDYEDYASLIAELSKLESVVAEVL